MSDQHFTYFKVENFKRFDALELTDIGQFNLVVGDNNVGKTSVLEALSVMYTSTMYQNPSQQYLDNIWQILMGRGLMVDSNIDFLFNYSAKDTNKQIKFISKTNGSYPSDFNIVGFQKKDHFNVSIKVSKLKHVADIALNSSNSPEFKVFNRNAILPLVRTQIPIEGLYKEYQNTINFSRSTKKAIIEGLKIIDKNIADIEVLEILEQQYVMIAFETGNDKYMPITSLGESAVRAFYYFLEIIKNKGRFLCIDEIDTGIHYSRMKEFLKQIVQTAVNNDVQLFLTTHSLECQEAFTEVFEMPDMVQHKDKVRQYTLIEKSDGQVVANKFNFNQLENALEIGFDTRGGERG